MHLHTQWPLLIGQRTCLHLPDVNPILTTWSSVLTTWSSTASGLESPICHCLGCAVSNTILQTDKREERVSGGAEDLQMAREEAWRTRSWCEAVSLLSPLPRESLGPRWHIRGCTGTRPPSPSTSHVTHSPPHFPGGPPCCLSSVRKEHPESCTWLSTTHRPGRCHASGADCPSEEATHCHHSEQGGSLL